MLFEKLQVPALQIQQSALTTLMAHGRMTGMAVQLGHELAQMTPVYEGTVVEVWYSQST